jgi:hypothetical protein
MHVVKKTNSLSFGCVLAECFSIRSGINGMLDVARTTFLQSIEDMYALAQGYEAQCNDKHHVH